MKVELRNVGFGYSPEQQVLQDINLVLDEPGLVCIIGPNGVGKSTLVKMLCKIIHPTSGEILVDDEVIEGMDQKDLAMKVGYVPPFTQDYFSMTVMTPS
ncbi:MAG: ABC transporter ATP-binding protein [Thermoplasmata archaeon]|nr:ABC transporter ATP-binding protein [Thermoplasmata archaeon]